MTEFRIQGTNNHYLARVVDWEQVMAQVDNDRDFILGSVRLFLESEYQAEWNLLKQAVLHYDALVVKQTAHSLRGAFAYEVVLVDATDQLIERPQKNSVNPTVVKRNGTPRKLK